MHEAMQVVILAGGLGTRLKAVASNVPKALVPVAGRPFIEHQLAILRTQGLDRIVLCVGFGADQIMRHVGYGGAFGVSVEYSREDADRLLGTGGAIVNALPLLDKEFLLLYGDSYLPTDYGAIIAAFRKSEHPALMTVFRNEGKWDKSNVRVEGDRVVFYSKTAGAGEADCIDYGLSVYRRQVFEQASRQPMPLDMAVIQGELVSRGAMGAFVVQSRFYEIGKPSGLDELDAVLRQGGA